MSSLKDRRASALAAIKAYAYNYFWCLDWGSFVRSLYNTPLHTLESIADPLHNPDHRLAIGRLMIPHVDPDAKAELAKAWDIPL